MHLRNQLLSTIKTGSTSYRVHMGFSELETQVLSEPQKALPPIHLCYAVELLSQRLIRLEFCGTRPSTASMERFCRNTLQKLKLAPATVRICIADTAGIDWNFI